MGKREINLRQLLHPMSPEEFFADYYDQRPLHIPGAADKFAHVFTWNELNALLESVHLWSEKTMRLVIDTVDVPPEEYSVPGHNRFLEPALIPDLKKVQEMILQGATLVLDRTERLTPTLARIADIIELSTGGRANCNAYCSWQAHQAFKSHYDSMDVFVLQIDGSKKWNIYETRIDGPVEHAPFDFASQSAEHHQIAKGKVSMTPELSTGDFLYVPAGQYHDALASTEVSLHLTFGSVRATGIDFMALVTSLESIASIPEFRRPLPHFDDASAHNAHIEELADKLHELLCDPSTAERVRGFQRQQSLGHLSPGFQLPKRAEHARLRVCDRGAKTVRRGPDWVLKTAGSETKIDPAEAQVAEWAIGREGFTSIEFIDAFGQGDLDLLGTLNRFSKAGLIEVV
jgi:ribosomal protein L16 Arg81 hydroxylase